MAAYLQNKHPNPCCQATNGTFGSKFVTVVVTGVSPLGGNGRDDKVVLLLGDENSQIHLRGYQVSNQCAALVRDDCLVPCMDTPAYGYIRESTGEQFVPDVFYTVRNNVLYLE